MKFLNWLASHTDGVCYVAMAVFGALAIALGKDSAKEFMSPVVLYWAQTFCEANAAGWLALKTYRSTAFANKQTEKKNGNGTPIKTGTQSQTNP